MTLLLEARVGLQAIFARAASTSASTSSPAGAATGMVSGSGDEDEGSRAYQLQPSVRDVLGVLREMGALPDATATLLAARAFVSDYLQAGLYSAGGGIGGIERMQVFSDEGAGGTSGAEGGTLTGADAVAAASQSIGEVEEREILAWLDMPMLFPDFVEGVVRLAQQMREPAEGGLQAKLRALLLEEGSGLFAALERVVNPPVQMLAPEEEA